MSYKLLASGGVLRLVDGARIPPDSANCDWLAYQAWLAIPSVPLASDSPATPQDYSNMDNLDKTLKSVGLLVRDYCNALKTGSYTGSGSGGTKTISEVKSDFMAKYNSLP